MTYNHAYSLGVAVSGSQYESADDCVKHEPMLVIKALLLRIAELTTNHAEMLEAMEGFDTYEE
jgi:hypothetical protein